MKKTNLFAILALAATPAFLHAQTTNFSDIVGYTTLNVRAKSGSANAFSYISLNVHRPTALRSVVGTKSLNGSGQSVVAVSSSLTANQFAGTSNKHYVRVTSGVNTGLISEIVSNDTSSITLADNLDAVLENGVTKFEVRPYWTLATAFPSGAGLKAGTSSTAADNVTIIDPATGTGNSYFYNSSASQWRRGTTDSSSIIIPPGSGIMVTRKDVTAVAIQISGEVITSSVLADVAGGTASAQKFTYVANPYPVASVTLAQSGLYTGNSATGVVGGTSATAADAVTIFDPTTGTGLSYFYNTSANQWRRGTTDSSNVTIPEGAAVMITRKANRGAFEWYIPSPIATINQ